MLFHVYSVVFCKNKICINVCMCLCMRAYVRAFVHEVRVCVRVLSRNANAFKKMLKSSLLEDYKF